MKDDTKTEYAWLIETDGPHYVYNDTLGGGSRFGWTKDAAKAIRFAREGDANDAMYALRETLPRLFDFPTHQAARAVEHGWTDSGVRARLGFDTPSSVRDLT